MDQLFHEKVTPFLRQKMAEVRSTSGPRSTAYLALHRQYLRDRRENGLVRGRDAAPPAVLLSDDGEPVVGIQRLHRCVATLRLTGQCAAHCRWCFAPSHRDDALSAWAVERAARYLGSERCQDVRELVVHGGDPLTEPATLADALHAVATQALNINVVRVHTRLPVVDPTVIDWRFLDVATTSPNLRCEVGLQVNHAVELWPETVAAIRRMQRSGIIVYNQHVLLKGVNDSADALTELYDRLRDIGVETDVVYHCAPHWGMDHHRTSLARGLQLLQRLSHRGAFSGRSNPTLIAQTDLGVVSLSSDAVVSRDEHGEVLLQTGHQLEQRMQWDPEFLLPRSVEIDDDGYLRVWYLDGTDVPYESVQKRTAQEIAKTPKPHAHHTNGLDTEGVDESDADGSARALQHLAR